MDFLEREEIGISLPSRAFEREGDGVHSCLNGKKGTPFLEAIFRKLRK